MSSNARQVLRNCTALIFGMLGVAAFAAYGGTATARGGGRDDSALVRETIRPLTPQGESKRLLVSGKQEPSPIAAHRSTEEPLVSAVTYFLSRPRPIQGTEYELSGGMGMDRKQAASLMNVAANRSLTFAEASEQCEALRLRAGVRDPCSYHQTVAAAAMYMLPSHAGDIAECLRTLWRNAAARRGSA